MGAASSTNKPWKDYEHYDLFSERFERVATLVTSISYYKKQQQFYQPLLVNKLSGIPDIQVTPIVVIFENETPPSWVLSKEECEPIFDKKVKKVVIRIQMRKDDATFGHDVTSVYFVDTKKLIFLDSMQPQYNHEKIEPFVDLLARWTGEKKISYVLPDPSCKMVQFMSLNCSTWSFFFSACVIFEGWEDPTSFLKSKSRAEMSHELRCFVAWIYFDLMNEELLEEKIFKYPELELFCLLSFPNSFDSITKQYLERIKERALFFMQHFQNWKSVLFCLGMALPQDEKEQQPFETIGSDLVDPHFFDEPCTCQKCGAFCLSEEWSFCKHEEAQKKYPRPIALEKYDHEKTEQDYENWLKNASPYLYNAASNKN